MTDPKDEILARIDQALAHPLADSSVIIGFDGSLTEPVDWSGFVFRRVDTDAYWWPTAAEPARDYSHERGPTPGEHP